MSETLSPEWELADRIKFIMGTVSQDDPRLFAALKEAHEVARRRINVQEPAEKERLVAEYVQDWIIKSGYNWLLDRMYPYPKAEELAVWDLSSHIGHAQDTNESYGSSAGILDFYLHFSKPPLKDLGAIRQDPLFRFLQQRFASDLTRLDEIACVVSRYSDHPNNYYPDYRIHCGFGHSQGQENFTIDAKLNIDKLAFVASQNGTGLTEMLYSHLKGVFKKMKEEYNCVTMH